MRWRELTGGIGLCGALMALLAGPALGDVAVTFRPPAGAHVLATGLAPYVFRTSDPQPTIGIEASAGSRLSCTLQDFSDTPPVTAPCGAPLPGCTAALCGSFRPSAPLAGRPAGTYDLEVEVLDAAGSQVGNRADQEFSVDLTPPLAKVDTPSARCALVLRRVHGAGLTHRSAGVGMPGEPLMGGIVGGEASCRELRAGLAHGVADPFALQRELGE